MKGKKHIFLASLVLTVLIFSTAMILNYSLDFFRLGSILGVINEHEISYDSYLTEESFVEAFGGDKCSTMNMRIEQLKQEIKDVGAELSNYGRISFFKKNDYEYLSRKYFLLQLKFLALIENLNRDCNRPYISILFFYETDDEISERQGYILSELSDKHKQNVVILSIDKDYKKEPLITALATRYNVTKAPTIIIANSIKYERLVYEKEIELEITRLVEDADFYGSGYDFGWVLDRTGINKSEFASNISSLLDSNISNFAKGDITLIAGRLEKNNSKVCSSAGFYENYTALGMEESAIIYETLASIGCGRNKAELLMNASRIWAQIGNSFRSKVDSEIASGKSPALEFAEFALNASRSLHLNISTITIGSSSIKLTSSDSIVSQADRVARDWLSYQLYASPFSEELLTTFSERLSYTQEELLPEIGWHEGGRIKELKEIGLSNEAVSGTIAAKKNGIWYAPDEKGVFRFEVPIDKILYPTTRFLSEDIAVIIDTHGINMLVEQALRKNASVVIGCCDHPGKINAAQYLAERNISVICFTDKYLPLLVGTNYSILGSPPMKKEGSSFVIGDQPLTFSTSSTIIAEDVENYTSVQSYYDTPARYFREMESLVHLNVIYVPLSRMNQTGKVIEVAEFFNAKIIAVRIFNSNDYYAVKGWLENNAENKAILFHSMAYPYGYRLMKEFPQQTTFDDINPILK